MASEENLTRTEPEGEESSSSDMSKNEKKQNQMDSTGALDQKTLSEPSSESVEKMQTDAPHEAGDVTSCSRETPEGTSDPPTEVVAESKAATEPTSSSKETVSFKVIYSKQKYDVSFPLDDTVASLKNHIESLTKVPATMQKVMYKGKMQDDATLRAQKVIKGSKIMVIGSTVNDVMSVSAPDAKTIKEIQKEASSSAKEPLSKQKPHKTVLEKHGKPDDVMIGVKKHKEPLPPAPISGMYNKSGGKVRLTFKMEQDQLWIGTKERTDKITMGSIKAVVSEPIDGHEEYHMMGIQLGPTEASRYWVYWVPAQYVDAIKDAILGKWQTELF